MSEHTDEEWEQKLNEAQMPGVVSDSAPAAGSVSEPQRKDENAKGYWKNCPRCHGSGCVSTKRYDPPEECDCWDRFQP